MAEFVEVARHWNRVCIKQMKCMDCSIYPCRIQAMANPCAFEKSIMDWAAEHPEKTMKDVFFEKFPNAPRDEDGEPTICPMAVGFPAVLEEAGYAGECLSDKCCGCWNRPAPEGF